MSDTTIRVVKSDAAGTMLAVRTEHGDRLHATRGAYHHSGFDPSFTWNLWVNGNLVDVATNRKDAERWLREALAKDEEATS